MLDILYKRTEETPDNVFYCKVVSPFSILKHKGLEADHFVLVGALACLDQNCSFCVTHPCLYVVILLGF